MLLLLPLLWCSVSADDSSSAGSRGKDSYLDAFMESHASLTAAGAPTASGAASSPQPQYSSASPQPQYGPPQPQPPQQPPQAQYGPPQAQYGPPQPQYGPPQPQYGPPQPQYGPPTAPQYGTPYGPAPLAASPVPFFEGLGAALWGLLSQLPLPDFHTALKIVLKVILIKGALKAVSLLLAMLFIPKLEDILNMIGSIMEMGMDLEMDKDKEKPMKPGHHKPGHHHDDDEEDGEAGDDNAAADSEDGQADAARSRSGAARSRMLNALAARVDEASARVAASLSAGGPCGPGDQGWPRCSRDQTHDDVPPSKLKKKVVNKGAV